MPSAVLLLPFFLIRFGLFALISRSAMKRAAHFAPMVGNAAVAYWVYQATTLGILLCPFFLHIKAYGLGFAGLALCGLGAALLLWAILCFAHPDREGLNTKGIYRFSRNPMYVAYFLYFLGLALATRSILLLCLVLAFQISAHWVIRAEEQECLEKFGAAYRQYMKRVRRYF